MEKKKDTLVSAIERSLDPGGSMGMFFEELFCSWISARQKAKLRAREKIS